MQTITPFLWFDTQAEEAANYYTSIFTDSRIVDVQRVGDGAPAPPGTVMVVTFELAGQRFIAMNGGPQYTFSEATSFYVPCRTQDEVDSIYDRLADGGEEIQCGWVKDRFGVTWQIVPEALPRLLSDPDPEKAGRVMQAMLPMKKLDIKTLQDAYEGR